MYVGEWSAVQCAPPVVLCVSMAGSGTEPFEKRTARVRGCVEKVYEYIACHHDYTTSSSSTSYVELVPT